MHPFETLACRGSCLFKMETRMSLWWSIHGFFRSVSDMLSWVTKRTTLLRRNHSNRKSWRNCHARDLLQAFLQPCQLMTCAHNKRNTPSNFLLHFIRSSLVLCNGAKLKKLLRIPNATPPDLLYTALPTLCLVFVVYILAKGVRFTELHSSLSMLTAA